MSSLKDAELDYYVKSIDPSCTSMIGSQQRNSSPISLPPLYYYICILITIYSYSYMPYIIVQQSIRICYACHPRLHAKLQNKQPICVWLPISGIYIYHRGAALSGPHAHCYIRTYVYIHVCRYLYMQRNIYIMPT